MVVLPRIHCAERRLSLIHIFPPELYRDFLGAESKGRFFLSQIRNQFRYERLARLVVANMK